MNKIVVITGATSGIGESTAKYLQSKGCIVYSLARRVKNLEGINYLSCDVTDKMAIDLAFKQIYEQEKRIDAVINNAGMGISGAFEYTAEEDAKKILNVNLDGVLNIDQAAIPYLKKSQGNLIHIGSIAGEVAIPFQTYYSLTKAAIHMLNDSLSLELKPFGVKLTCVMPGDTKTGFTGNRIKGEKNDDYGQRIKHSVNKMEKDEQKGADPIKVGKVIYKCLNKKHPPLKVAVGFGYKAIILLNKILPAKIVNSILYSMYGK